MTFENTRLAGIIASVVGILLIPYIAMQLNVEGVDWKLNDFVIMGTLLLGTGLLTELAMRTVKNMNARIALVVILVAALLLAWVELAVGIFGSPLAGS